MDGFFNSKNSDIRLYSMDNRTCNITDRREREFRNSLNYIDVAAAPDFTTSDTNPSDIIETAIFLNNMAPHKLPAYKFNLDEINGERYYKPDGSLLFVREVDSEYIRDYYPSKNFNSNSYSVNRILEHSKINGRLKVKIEPVLRQGCNPKVNIVIFDENINHKYILLQLNSLSNVINISEFSSNGRFFRTLFRNKDTMKPVRYLEGKDNKYMQFEIIDCIINENFDIVKIKRFTNKKNSN